MIELLIALVLALTMPRPALLSTGSLPPSNVLRRNEFRFPPAEVRTGKLVYYAEDWEDWTCPADQKCGIAARQGVTLLPGETCVATWYREDRNRTGTLRIGARTIPVRVCDYAHPKDLPRIQEQGIAGEIPYPLAATVPGMTESGWVTGTLILGPIVSTALPATTTNAGTPTAWAFSPLARNAPATGRLLPQLR